MEPIIVFTFFRMIFILAVALTGGSILTEKGEGTMERCLVAGVTMIEILLSHIITEFVIMVGQTAIVLGFAFVIFDVQNVGPWIWVITLSLLQGVNGMSLGDCSISHAISKAANI